MRMKIISNVVLIVCFWFLSSAGSSLTIAIRNWDYDTLDPHISCFTQSMWMINMFTDTLVRMGPDGKIYPGLAESWEMLEQGRVWVFHLRPGVKFHDGTPWNAGALIENFKRVLAPETRSLRFVDKLQGLVRMEALDELTVRLTFDRPVPGFLIAISEPICGFLSPTAFNNPNIKTSPEKLKGTGPWILVNELYQQRVVFQKNPEYNWGPAFAAHQGPAFIDEVIWRFIPEDETRLAALLTGEVDVIDEVAPAQVDNVKLNPQFYVLIYVKPGVAQVYHLNASLPPTDELAVRQAINYAIDQKAISDVIFRGTRPPAYGLFMPSSPYYNPEVELMYAYSPEKAKDLLEAAGWIDVDGDGIREKEGRKLTINFITYPGFVAEAPAEMAQAMLRKVGIQMDITVTTGSAMMELCGMVDSSYNSCLCGDSAVDTAMETYYFCHSKMIGGFNFAHYASPELDALIETALTTLNEDEKKEALFKIQKIWMELALCKPIVCSSMVLGVSSRVEGIDFLLDGTPNFYDAHIK
ncbi:MAG: ABC transporter substrate-binding protein [Candidatus Methanomethyliaceae archaeon]